ncbi:MAG: hypothetical protein WBP45_05950 [Daejeonella sp.]
MKRYLLFTLILLLWGCKPDRKVSTSFYYWKTVYRTDQTEQEYFSKMQSQKLYMRIMDVAMDESGTRPVPISPIEFKEPLPASTEIVPVVYLVNDVLKQVTETELKTLSAQMAHFVTEKVKRSGSRIFREVQLDCDWMATTRDKYFYLLKQLRLQAGMKGKILSVTLRLHKLKNLKSSGIPPADKVLLMCYNMGNLRKYGSQNSILEISELKKYTGENLSAYPLPMDVALPLFSWCVVFRNKEYAGISKSLNPGILRTKALFKAKGNNEYEAIADMEDYGLRKADLVRYEEVSAEKLLETSRYLSSYLAGDSLNLIFYHLDKKTITKYTDDELKKIRDSFY